MQRSGMLVGITAIAVYGCSSSEPTSPAVDALSLEAIPRTPAGSAPGDLPAAVADKNMPGSGVELVKDTRSRQLLSAAASGDLPALKALLANKGDVDTVGETGNSALLAAVFFERRECFDFLLSEGADPNRQNDHGDSPISVAANKELGNGYWLEAILRSGGNPNLVNDKASEESAQFGFTNTTPIFDALRAMNIDNVTLLIDAGARTDWKDERGISLLGTAVAIHQFDIALLLLEHGADYDSPAENGGSIGEYLVGLDEDAIQLNQRKYLVKAADFIENAKHDRD